MARIAPTFRAGGLHVARRGPTLLIPLSRFREREAKCVGTWQVRGILAISSSSRRKPGPSDFVVRHPCFFPRRPAARFTFLSGKVTKAIGAGHDGLANVRLSRLPCASRRALAGANSHIPVLGHRAFPARPAAMLGVMRRRRSSLRHGHPWPALYSIGTNGDSVLPPRMMLRMQPLEVFLRDQGVDLRGGK